MDDFAENFRDEQLPLSVRRSEHKAKLLREAESLVAKRRNEYAEATAQQMRLANEECPVSECPDCFFMRHVASPVKPIPYKTASIDLFKCETCGHEWEQPEEF